MKIFSFLLIIVVTYTAAAQSAPIGIFDRQGDIGNPKRAGYARYDEPTQTYTVGGAGSDVWGVRDELHFLYKKIAGDFILTANFEFSGDEKGNPHRKTGWMVRELADAGAASMSAVLHGDGLHVMQWRQSKGDEMKDPEDQIFFPKKGCQIVQLERSGATLTMRVAHPGEPLQTVGSQEIAALKSEILAGLYVCSHDPDKMEEARVWNVRIDKPVPNDYSPNPIVAKTLPRVPQNMNSRMEIMDVFDGKRKVIFEAKGRFEAPNFMPDGKKLLFNQDGALYTIPIEGGVPEKLRTGTVKGINNDHGITFDGKMLAISGAKEGATGYTSVVYILPLSGGVPKPVADIHPSYWHGWSNTGKEVTIVAQRNGVPVYNLYKVDVNTGKETALTTNTTGHVDGPEYSPDGRYIYYNANPTGTMQLWRMKPDGSNREQLTFDEYNNWFPHISPDGKWIAFISFPPDIDPDSHPSYKRVMLRLMPTYGGAPKVIAWLYGGQGTINVNSWSPDSKHIAFVSNSDNDK